MAARNCLLGEGNHLRLSDAALSRDLFPADYHCLGDNENRFHIAARVNKIVASPPFDFRQAHQVDAPGGDRQGEEALEGVRRGGFYKPS